MPVFRTISNYLADVDQVVTPLDPSHLVLVKRLSLLIDRLSQIREKGGRVYVCGNGGSASNASHLVLHLRDVGIKAFDLMADIPWLTAKANDQSYDRVFSSSLEALGGGSDDMLVAISGSGNSANIIMALEYAVACNMTRWGLLGMGGGRAWTLCDDAVVVPSDNYGVIEDIHSIVVHALHKALLG